MGRRQWRAAVHGVTMSQTQLSDFQNGLRITGRNAKWYNFYVNIVWQFLKKLNIKVSDDPAIPLQGIDPKELRTVSQTNPCTQIFTAAVAARTKRWKQPKCPLTDEWINKLQRCHTTKYYSALKRNEVLIHTTTKMNLKSIVLSKGNQR